MADHLRLVHTAQAHVARFDALRDAIAPGVTLTHVVAEDLLERARHSGITAAVLADLRDAIGPDPATTICTCTTLGAAAEGMGAIRIDRPMMTAAALLGGRVHLAVALESTADTCRAALDDSIARAGSDATIDLCVIPDVWPLFEAGDLDGFARKIASHVQGYLNGHSCVVLAQASMTEAANLIDHPHVLTSPSLALRAAIAR